MSVSDTLALRQAKRRAADEGIRLRVLVWSGHCGCTWKVSSLALDRQSPESHRVIQVTSFEWQHRRYREPRLRRLGTRDSRPILVVDWSKGGLMTEVGAYEAKTHLSQLLDRVARGEDALSLLALASEGVGDESTSR